MKFTWFAPRVLLFPLATIFLVATCFAQDTDPTVRFTITPGISTPIYIKALPNGLCMLQTDGLQDAAHTLKLFADQEGMVYFNATPHGSSFKSSWFVSDDVTPLLLQCTTTDDEVTTHTYRIELRASYNPSPEFPAPPPLPKPVGTIRPGLTDDQLNLSDEELLKAGYPIRPDPNQEPGAYASWLARVSRPTTVVVPQTVSRPDVKFGPTTPSYVNNWSGFQLLQASGGSVTGTAPTPEQYDLVMGEWRVPCVDCADDLIEVGHAAEATWIGLDDDSAVFYPNGQSPTCPGCYDLLQDGTTADVVTNSSSTMSVAIYFAWYENIRGNCGSPDGNGCPPVGDIYPLVRPGDRMFSQIFVANCLGPVVSECGPPNPSITTGLSVVFYVQDDTAGWTVPPQVVPINGFSGLTAEWIVERPTGICSAPYMTNLICDLADYGGGAVKGEAIAPVFMYWAIAETGTGEWLAWNSNAETKGNVDIWMYGCFGPAIFTCQDNLADRLSSAAPASIDPNLIQFFWYNFH